MNERLPCSPSSHFLPLRLSRLVELERRRDSNGSNSVDNIPNGSAGNTRSRNDWRVQDKNVFHSAADVVDGQTIATDQSGDVSRRDHASDDIARGIDHNIQFGIVHRYVSSRVLLKDDIIDTSLLRGSSLRMISRPDNVERCLPRDDSSVNFWFPINPWRLISNRLDIANSWRRTFSLSDASVWWTDRRFRAELVAEVNSTDDWKMKSMMRTTTMTTTTRRKTRANGDWKWHLNRCHWSRRVCRDRMRMNSMRSRRSNGSRDFQPMSSHEGMSTHMYNITNVYRVNKQVNGNSLYTMDNVIRDPSVQLYLFSQTSDDDERRWNDNFSSLFVSSICMSVQCEGREKRRDARRAQTFLSSSTGERKKREREKERKRKRELFSLEQSDERTRVRISSSTINEIWSFISNVFGSNQWRNPWLTSRRKKTQKC